MSATSTKMDLPVKTKPTGEKGNIKSCIHCSRWVGRAEYPNNGVTVRMKPSAEKPA